MNTITIKSILLTMMLSPAAFALANDKAQEPSIFAELEQSMALAQQQMVADVTSNLMVTGSDSELMVATGVESELGSSMADAQQAMLNDVTLSLGLKNHIQQTAKEQQQLFEASASKASASQTEGSVDLNRAKP
ncbi:MAG: hypothetical protein ACRCT7_17485 [Shewanella sp.]